MRNFAIYLSILMILCSSCKKNDTSPPTIRILNPSPNSSWEIGGSISLLIEIEDDQAIEYARIVLLDENSWAVGNSLSYSFSDKKITLDDQFPLDHSNLKNGYYKLQVTVGDGSHEVYASVTIILFGAKEDADFQFIITESSSSVNIYTIDSNFCSQLWHTMSADFLDARADPENRALYIAPKSKGKLTSISAHTQTINWQVASSNPVSKNWFQGIELLNNSLYTGNYGGETEVYNHSGAIVNYIVGSSDYMPSKFLYFNQNTFIYSLPKNSGLKSKITSYSLGLGIIRDTYTQYKVKKMFRKNDDHLLLFSNTISGFVISSFYWFYGNENILKTVDQEQINDVISLDTETFILSTDQNIYQYDVTQNSLNTLIQSGADCLDFNAKNRWIIYAKNKTLYFYSYEQRTLFATIPNSDKIVKILHL